MWFLVSGEGKADAVARALADEGSVQDTPARGITVANTTWFLDAGRRQAPCSPADRAFCVHARSTPSGHCGVRRSTPTGHFRGRSADGDVASTG